jgi:cytochrome oxidase Cu insertion factor (SCO1/SenC/PrrC family)
MTRPREPKRRGSLLPLWLVVIVFAMPVAAAWLLFFNPQYLPAGRLNWGDLIQPPVSLPTADLRSPDGTAFDAQALAGKWALVYLDAAQCGERCLQRLRDLRRIYLALGERRQGVERLLILADPPPKSSMDNLEQDFDRCRPGRAKRRPVVPGRCGRERIVAVA